LCRGERGLVYVGETQGRGVRRKEVRGREADAGRGARDGDGAVLEGHFVVREGWGGVEGDSYGEVGGSDKLSRAVCCGYPGASGVYVWYGCVLDEVRDESLRSCGVAVCCGGVDF
jgi:hypothetical protein